MFFDIKVTREVLTNFCHCRDADNLVRSRDVVGKYSPYHRV